MASYKKSVKGDHNQANENWSGNRIQVFNDGSGKLIIVFAAIFATAAIVYLAIFQTFLLTTSVVVCFVVGIGGGGFLWYNHLRRDHSRTHKELLVNKNEVWWSEVTHALTESLVAHIDKKSGGVNVVNARDVTEHHNYAPQQTFISEPTKAKQLHSGGEGFSELLGKRTDG